MEYISIGSSNVKASRITFGAWAIGGWMWGGSERSDAVEAILAALDEGVTSIDTAPVYGQGLSEEIVGEAIKGKDRTKLQLMTKFGMRWDLAKGDHAFESTDNHGNPISVYKYASRESVITECENSLKRLGTDYIDLYQIHWPDITTPIAETMEAVDRLLQQGKILAAGVSNYNVSQMEEAMKVVPLASNQVPYSMLERSIEKDVVPFSLKNNVSIIAYSPLQRGLLTGKIKPGHQFGEGDHRPNTKFYKEENIRRTNEFLSKIKPMADEKVATLSQLVLRWTLEQPGITIALAGARNKQQAVDNAKAGSLTLTTDEMNQINKHLGDLQLVF